MIPLSDSVKSRTFPIFTILIIALNIYIFFLELTSSNLDTFIGKYALIPNAVNFGNIDSLYPFITSMFLHSGWLHIGSNMLFLWVFGDNIEDVLGRFRFILFYLTCGVVAALTQYLFNPNSDVPMLGASGAVAGVLGAYWLLFPRSTVNTLIPIGILLTSVEIPAVFMIGFWFLTQIFSGVTSFGIQTQESSGGVAFWAHIGGFVCGLVLVKLFPPRKRAYA